jgi:hypothetical protein
MIYLLNIRNKSTGKFEQNALNGKSIEVIFDEHGRFLEKEEGDED